MVLYKAIRDEWDRRNDPPPTGLEAIEAVKIMWNSELGQCPWSQVQITSGNRHTWVRGRRLTINPNREYGTLPHTRGWAELIHDTAHDISWRKNPKEPNHGKAQARIERRLQRLVIDRLLS